jgi:nucleoside-diphosphate-sugar epimerase
MKDLRCGRETGFVGYGGYKMNLQNEHLWKDRKVIITGGLGFIGSNLARRLVDYGAQVTLVDSLVPEYGGNLFNIEPIHDRSVVNISDVRDAHSLRHLVKGMDILFNLAGQTSHLDSMSDPQTDLDINCKSQLSILETCRKENPEIKVVFASTRQIYGKPDYLPVDEKHSIRPVDVNGINKVAGEQYHILYNKVYGIKTTVLRLTNTYGPRMRIKDARQTFLGVWIKKILAGEPFEVWEGEQLRDFTYVDDCVEALMQCALSALADGRVFNLGGADEPVSLVRLAEMLIAANGGVGSFERKNFPAERKAIDIGDYYSDMSLIQETVGWQPKVGLREGLEKSLNYFRSNLDKYL